jgi:hypothetical protein
MSIATVSPLHPASRSARPSARTAAPVRAQSGQGARPALRLVPADRAGRGGRVDRAVPARPLRLTRRGRAVLRLLVLVAACVLVVAGVLALQRTASAGQQAPAAAPVTYHVVLPGETLWGIARQVAPGRDARETVARIIELNALPGGQVYAGQRLALQP